MTGTVLAVRVAISFLCAVGFYCSVFMLRKSVLAQRGELSGPSVVQSPRAALFGGVPNALFGGFYYALAAAAAWAGGRPVLCAALAAAGLAAAVSLYLAYSLLYVTRRSCPYCWTAHMVNWCLAAAFAALLALP